jgi:long-chain acyl-CoA synthetase
VREGAEVDERTVRAYCKAVLEAGHMPRFIEFRDALPRTLSGKLLRRALAQT